MMNYNLIPDFIFESSWEVCNKVGGIYTVLSTRARVLQDQLKDRIIFIGPALSDKTNDLYFEEDHSLFPQWKATSKFEDLQVRVGRWTVPGRPIAVLVDFSSLFEHRNDIYARLWEDFQVDSLHGYGDYDEATMFSIAAAKVVESFYHANLSSSDKVIYQANEWMTGAGLLYLKKHVPRIATVFTTHATSIGRSIAGNDKPLYDYLSAYNGDQMAEELNMQSKHSIEKQTAHHADCFTTVSDITARECSELLDKSVDMVLPNGFENDFVPDNQLYAIKRKAARKRLLQVANALLGTELKDDTIILSTSGRYEFRNKGIDVFIEAMNQLKHDEDLKRNILAFIEVPGWVAAPREDLQERLQENRGWDEPLEQPVLTHWLHNMNEDRVLNMFRYLNIRNNKQDRVKVIFIPCYLTGDDGILNLSYYDLVLGNDLCIYPSYYEPWGYTPLESIAFKVPCITTDLAGFGLWVNSELGRYGEISDGVKVIHRTDYNYFEVAESVRKTVIEYIRLSEAEKKQIQKKAEWLSEKALWDNFIKYYFRAYHIALTKCAERNNKN